jgi:EmrB/QacA subfamily drug resistance transporter
MPNFKTLIIPLVIACALFMEMLDSSIITTSIPQMALALAIDPISLKMVMTSYLISLAIFIPMSGWLADKYGAKQIFILAFIIFTLASVACATSSSLLELVIYRIIQGFGGSIMMPVGRLILLRIFKGKDMVWAMAYVTVPALIGPVLGPVIGGLITTYFSWHWIFMVNLPIGIVGIFLAIIYIPNVKPIEVSKFDFIGFIFFGFGIAFLAFFLTTVSEESIRQDIKYCAIIISLIFLLAYGINYRFFGSSLLNLNIFKTKTFKIGIIGSLFSRAGIAGIPFLLPMLFQINLGYSPIGSGIFLLFLAIGMMVAKFSIKFILKKLGFRNTLVLNTILIGLFTTSLSLLGSYYGYLATIITLLIIGFLSSLQYTCMNVITYVDLDKSMHSQGTSISSLTMQLSNSFGVIVASVVLRFFMHGLGDFSLKSFNHSFILIGAFTILASSIFLFLNNDDGNKASGHKILNQ